MAMASTRWSLVLRAGAGSVTALEGLCGAYWFPVYAYLRRRGLGPEDASEQTQEFFLGLLRRNDLARVTRDGGRFRSWLFTALKHHHLREVARQQTAKRSHDEVDDAEERLQRQVAPGLDPEQVFARQWALATIESAKARLRERYESRGDGAVFQALQGTLGGGTAPYATIAEQLDMNEGSVKVAAHRLRKRFGEALRIEVADTLDGPEEIEAELRSLMDALSGR